MKESDFEEFSSIVFNAFKNAELIENNSDEKTEIARRLFIESVFRCLYVMFRDPGTFKNNLIKIIDACGETGEVMNFSGQGFNSPTELGYMLIKNDPVAEVKIAKLVSDFNELFGNNI